MYNPVTFEGCFGWYHQGSADLGIVLCAPHGHGELCAHRHWRELAHKLAARGLPVLRFDYPGTGDSADADETPGRVRAWIQSIHSAAAALRASAGVERIALVGLRIGAILALAAAEEMDGVAALALLAPLTSGEACVRELRALAMMATAKRHRDMQASARSGSLEPAGFLYTKKTLEDLRALPLLRSGRRLAESILLLDRPNTTPDQDFRARIRESGAELEEGIFEDYPLLLRDAGLSGYPDVGFGRVIDWLAARARPAAARSSEVALSSVLALPDSNETPADFHDDPASFGVLCTPHGVAAARPTLVFLNTGANHHIGMGRMTVTMARRLAAIGFTSFRFDIGGIGDSDPPPDRSLNHPINPAMVADVRRALDWLQSQGHSEFILIGVCSGGKLALHTTLEDKRVIGQMLLNLQGFWKAADPTNQYLSRRAYIRLALRERPGSGSFAGIRMSAAS
jgi:pimeloyl-ACP methyl ester carboxylesterase